jgi:flagellar protein FlaG
MAMAQNVISTAILIIAAVIAVVVLINAMFPAVYDMSGSVTSISASSNDRMKTDARIICESIDPVDQEALHVYVKNTGRLGIAAQDLSLTDVYFGNGTYMSKARPTGHARPAWEHSILGGNGDSSWDPGETLDVLVQADDYDFSADTQKVKIVLHNGISCEDEFTLQG